MCSPLVRSGGTTDQRGKMAAMIRQIAPQFFTTEMAATLAYYQSRPGFDCVSTWDDPPVYAIVAE